MIKTLASNPASWYSRQTLYSTVDQLIGAANALLVAAVRVTCTYDDAGTMAFSAVTLGASSGAVVGALAYDADAGIITIPVTLPAAIATRAQCCDVSAPGAVLADMLGCPPVGIAATGTDATLTIAAATFALGLTSTSAALDFALSVRDVG